MSLESELKKLNENLARLCGALESGSTAASAAPDEPASPAASTKKSDSAEGKTSAGKSGSGKKTSTTSDAKSAPDAEDQSSDDTTSAPGDADGSSLSKEDVRAKLMELGEKRGDKNKLSMELLQKVGGAKTIGGVEESNYQALYDACVEAIAEAEASGGDDEKDPLDD